MNHDDSRDARLAATSVLPAIDPPPSGCDDFAATTLDRPVFDLEALAQAHAPPPGVSPPVALPPPRAKPVARPPESDAMLWIVLALLIASALGIGTALVIGLASTLAAPESAEVETFE